MANLVIGAIITKLGDLLKEEYNLQTGVKDRIKTLTQELELAQAALCKVAEVPWGQLDKQVQIWARKVQEASYDMEDVLDNFLVHVKGPDCIEEKHTLQKHLKRVTNFFKKTSARRKISGDVKDILSHLLEVTEQSRRYKVDDIVAKPATPSTVDPRLHAMYTQVNKLVGVDKSSGELMSMLQSNPQRGDTSSMKMKIVSIVGVGGLGKTTLAKVVYDKIEGDFDCAAFVPVGRNPDLKKICMDILIDLDKQRYLYIRTAGLDERQLIDELRNFLENKKRYLIVIDDLWEKQSWETLKLAIPDDKSCEGRIIITTRKWEVAKNADEVYELPPLPDDRSRKLFYSRIYGDDVKFIDYQQPDEVSNEILRKCAGIPLAIITMASLLVHEPRDRWFELYKSIGFGCKYNEDAEHIMKKILSFSYYDLPPYLRTCLLYISAFLEDSVIPKVSLVWMWVAEGFVQKREGKGFFETGEGYFNDLINRSLIQEVDEDDFHGCRVHDMVLDFIRSMSKEENFFTICDNNSDQGKVVQSNNVVRRLADHDMTMVHNNQANIFELSKVRSFIALERVIDTWAPLASFKLVRVLNIAYHGIAYNTPLRIEHLEHLLHLRFLCIRGRSIEKIPGEIGALKLLQTLDLAGCWIQELPSSGSLPTQLVCLRMTFGPGVGYDEVFSVGRLPSLEELSIRLNLVTPPRQFVKELGSMRELRVLDAQISLHDEETQRHLVEAVGHMHKLQHLKIVSSGTTVWYAKGMEFVVGGDLRRLVCTSVELQKLPSCIDPLCHRKLSHLDLMLLYYMDEQELKTLGRLPELLFLRLDLRHSSPTISNISDSNACYFPKLRCLILLGSMVLFVANRGHDGKKTVSFHIWNGRVDGHISLPSVSDAMLQGGNNEFPSVVQWETGKGDVRGKSDDVHPSRTSFHPSKRHHGIAMPPVSDEQKIHGSNSTTKEDDGQGTATPRFMPRLQVLQFDVPLLALLYYPNCCDNLGLEILSILQEISVDIQRRGHSRVSMEAKQVEAVLRWAAQVHPNHPTHRITIRH